MPTIQQSEEVKIGSIQEAFKILNESNVNYCVLEEWAELPQMVHNKTIVILTESRDTVVRLWGLTKEYPAVYRFPVKGMADQTVVLYEKGTDRVLPESWITALFRQAVIHNDCVKVPDTLMDVYLTIWRHLFWKEDGQFSDNERKVLIAFVKERIGHPFKPKVQGHIKWNGKGAR